MVLFYKIYCNFVTYFKIIKKVSEEIECLNYLKQTSFLPRNILGPYPDETILYVIDRMINGFTGMTTSPLELTEILTPNASPNYLNLSQSTISGMSSMVVDDTSKTSKLNYNNISELSIADKKGFEYNEVLNSISHFSSNNLCSCSNSEILIKGHTSSTDKFSTIYGNKNSSDDSMSQSINYTENQKFSINNKTSSAINTIDLLYKKAMQQNIDEKIPKLIKTQWAVTKINYFDDLSKTYDIIDTEQNIEAIIKDSNINPITSVIFAVLCDGSTVCYEPYYNN